MHIYRSAILIVLTVFTFVSAAMAEPLAGKIQARYDSLLSMKGEFTQVLTHKESGVQERRNGVLYFKKPLLVRWEIKRPARELLLVTPKEIWNVFSDEDLAYKYAPDMTDDSRGLVRVVTGQSRLEQDFYIENKGEDNGLTKLLAYPKEPTQAMTEAVFWVGLSTNLIKRFRIIDFYGNENDITFTSQEVDVPIADDLFSFTPAKGMKVEDRSKSEAGTTQPPLMR